jgi:hypothetical protein
MKRTAEVVVPPVVIDKSRIHGSFQPPTRYYFDRYYTQDPKDSLFATMRRLIKSPCEQTVLTLGSMKLWEVGNYVFITDKEYAQRAQRILIKAKKLNKYTAYHFCTDLR